MTHHHPPVLIEQWLPFEAIGAESQRERSSMTALPPIYYLHVWFARRPLTASRAAILAGMLPQWSADWPEQLRQHFPDEASYRAWFVNLIGIKGDPAAMRRVLQVAKEQGINLGPNPYGAPRAFTVNPSADDLRLLRDLLEFTWGTRNPITMDVTAGGGSIPFEALRFGITTYANELNPVASVILKATLDYPARYGADLAGDIKKWGTVWSKRVQERLAPYFPKQQGENIFAYLWARTVACPITGKPVPLSPNWWLSHGDGEKNVAAQLVADPMRETPYFVIKRGDGVDFDPDRGTVRGGDGLSPWTGEAIDADYIKAEAQAGRMGQMLYAVVRKRPSGLDFRAPTDDDQDAVRRAETELAKRLPHWEAAGLVPSEIIPDGNKTHEPLRYGFTTWSEMFSPRQLLAMLTFLELLQALAPEINLELGKDRATAIEIYLGIMLDKSVIYNNKCERFDPTKGIRSIFDRHDFAFVWSHPEYDASTNLLPWALAGLCT